MHQLICHSHGIVRAVRASNGLFGSDFSKRTKFGPDVVNTILFRFLMGAKVGTPRDRVIGEIQYGHH
jgi:hypothetical protein